MPSPGIPVLTLWQPWASLVAMGVKTIETRSWSTKHRGPLAIHAAARRTKELDDWALIRKAQDHYPCGDCGHLLNQHHAGPNRVACVECGHDRIRLPVLTLGAILATTDLVDVVPIHEWGCPCDHADGIYALLSPSSMGSEEIVGLFESPGGAGVVHPSWSPSRLDPIDDRHPRHQAPYGDFRCGRFAWLLADVEPLPEPVPFKGGQRLTRRWTP